VTDTVPGIVVADTPLVSVLIANHNYERFVVEAVESALAQTYARLEVVVVDDASTDGSVDLLRRTFGERIRVVALADNVGQVRAIEAGLGHVSGDIVCLLDADDRWQPQKVERVVSEFARRPELVQVSHGLRSIDADGRRVRGRRRSSSRIGLARRMPLNDGDVRAQLFRWNRYGYAVTSGLSYPRWVLEEMTPMPERFEGRSTYFDTWSTVAAAFLGPVGSIDAPLMDYRVHGANAAGGSIDFGRFVSCWTMTGRLVDHWARRSGDPRRASVEQRDGRLALFRFLDGEDVPLRRRLRAVAVAPIESVDIGAGAVETTVSALERIVMACSRRHGAAVKRLGLRRWARDAVSVSAR
jgi:glycosyltransferase involved in cell wall biosynthesis